MGPSMTMRRQGRYQGRRAKGRTMVLALAAMASVATPVSGSPAPVTMESAMHEVLSWHPSVVQAAATLDARGEDVTIARAGYLPRISAGVGSGYDSRLGSIWRPRPQLSASQMLYDFGKVASAVDYARRSEERRVGKERRSGMRRA